jgi:ankyrin repeat protein
MEEDKSKEVENDESSNSDKDKLIKQDSTASSTVSLKHSPSSWSLNSTSPLLQRQRKRSVTVSSVPPNPEDLLDKRDSKGRTQLFLAVRDGDITDAKRLLNIGSNVNLTDNYNMAPLHEATEKINADMIELLLDNGKYKSSIYSSLY